MISNGEYANRRKSIQNVLKKNKFDAYIVSDPCNIFYFTGATYKADKEPTFFIIFKVNEEPTFLVPLLEEAHMKKARIADIIAYGSISKDITTFQTQLAQILSDAPRVGVEPCMSLATKIKIDMAIQREVHPIELVETLRRVKSPEEVEMIRKACVYADEGMRLMLKGAYHGVSVLEIYSTSKKLQMKVLRFGTFDPFQTEFLTVGWPAPASAEPHSIPPLNGRFKKGPLAAMSIQRINGYFAENERTFFLQTPSEKERTIFNDMRDARKKAFNLIKPGIDISEIDKIVKNFLVEKGYKNNLLHTFSHGIGLELHESPVTGRELDFKLEENMVISVEPGIYFPEIGGFRHSDTVLVTKDGYEVLTHFPTDIESLTINKPRLLKKLKGKLVQKAVNMKPEEINSS